MAQKSQDSMKGTSPSKNIQRGVDTAWGAQNKSTTNPQAAIAKKYTNNPVPIKGNSK